MASRNSSQEFGANEFVDWVKSKDSKIAELAEKVKHLEVLLLDYAPFDSLHSWCAPFSQAALEEEKKKNSEIARFAIQKITEDRKRLKSILEQVQMEIERSKSGESNSTLLNFGESREHGKKVRMANWNLTPVY